MTSSALDVPNVSILTDDNLVDDAINAAAMAEEAEAEAGSPYRWRMADSYAVLTERGWQGKEIASRCGVSQSTVSQYLKCARIYQDKSQRPRFTDAFNEARLGQLQPSQQTRETHDHAAWLMNPCPAHTNHGTHSASGWAIFSQAIVNQGRMG